MRDLKERIQAAELAPDSVKERSQKHSQKSSVGRFLARCLSYFSTNTSYVRPAEYEFLDMLNGTSWEKITDSIKMFAVNTVVNEDSKIHYTEMAFVPGFHKAIDAVINKNDSGQEQAEYNPYNVRMEYIDADDASLVKLVLTPRQGYEFLDSDGTISLELEIGANDFEGIGSVKLADVDIALLGALPGAIYDENRREDARWVTENM